MSIVISGHFGSWHIIDQLTQPDGQTYFLLEHDKFGDEAACLIVDENLNIILDSVWNGWGDLEEFQA
jgi:hypothetical protein